MHAIALLGYTELRIAACVTAIADNAGYVAQVYDWYAELRALGYIHGGSFYDYRTYEWVFWMSR
jgi:hypothetical protein